MCQVHAWLLTANCEILMPENHASLRNYHRSRKDIKSHYLVQTLTVFLSACLNLTHLKKKKNKENYGLGIYLPWNLMIYDTESVTNGQKSQHAKVIFRTVWSYFDADVRSCTCFHTVTRGYQVKSSPLHDVWRSQTLQLWKLVLDSTFKKGKYKILWHNDWYLFSLSLSNGRVMTSVKWERL